MKSYIKNRINELKNQKSHYYELLENSKIFSTDYIVSRIRSCNERIEELELLLEEMNVNEERDNR